MMENPKSDMTAGEVAREAGVSTQTIHYYERSGLLPRARRNDADYRMFGREAVTKTRFVKRAQRLGFTLHEIRELLSLSDNDVNECAEAKARAERKVAEIDLKVKSLISIQRALSRLIEECSENPDAARCPLLHLDENEEEE